MQRSPIVQDFCDLAPYLSLILIVVCLFQSCENSDLEENISSLEDQVQEEYEEGFSDGQASPPFDLDEVKREQFELGFSEGAEYMHREYQYTWEDMDAAFDKGCQAGYEDAYFELTGHEP